MSEIIIDSRPRPLEQYVAASCEEMRDVVSPLDLVIGFDEAPIMQHERPGRFVIGNWLMEGMSKRFGDDPSEVVKTLPAFGYLEEYSCHPGSGRCVGGLGRYRYEFLLTDELDARHEDMLHTVAMPDDDREEFHSLVATLGLDMLRELRSVDSTVTDLDIHRYIEDYDRLQGAHIARMVMRDRGILPREPRSYETEVMFDQVDWEALPIPADSSIKEVIENDSVIKKIPPYKLDLLRLSIFDKIAKVYGKDSVSLYRSRPRAVGAEPYYIAEIINSGSNDETAIVMAVAESPVYGNATYLVDERKAAGTWQEVLELSKAEARSVGSARIPHPTHQEHNTEQQHESHQKRVMRWLRYRA